VLYTLVSNGLEMKDTKQAWKKISANGQAIPAASLLRAGHPVYL